MGCVFYNPVLLCNRNSHFQSAHPPAARLLRLIMVCEQIEYYRALHMAIPPPPPHWRASIHFPHLIQNWREYFEDCIYHSASFLLFQARAGLVRVLPVIFLHLAKKANLLKVIYTGEC